MTKEVQSNEEDLKEEEIDTSIKNATRSDEFYVAEDALDQSSSL